MRAKVVEVIEAHGLILAVLELLADDVAVGMIIGDATNRWRVTGISTVPAHAWHTGRRGVNLRPLGERVLPMIGAELRVLPIGSGTG